MEQSYNDILIELKNMEFLSYQNFFRAKLLEPDGKFLKSFVKEWNFKFNIHDELKKYIIIYPYKVKETLDCLYKWICLMIDENNDLKKIDYNITNSKLTGPEAGIYNEIYNNLLIFIKKNWYQFIEKPNETIKIVEIQVDINLPKNKEIEIIDVIQTDKNSESKIELLNNNYELRPNQKEAFDHLEKNGLVTGIHCQATGCGKSYIIIKYIDYTNRNYQNPKIILFTERVNILSDLFGFKNNEDKPDSNKIIEWKNRGIGDLTNFKIINRVTIKKNDWIDLLKKSKEPTLLVINRAYLTLGKTSEKKIQ